MGSYAPAARYKCHNTWSTKRKLVRTGNDITCSSTVPYCFFPRTGESPSHLGTLVLVVLNHVLADFS